MASSIVASSGSSSTARTIFAFVIACDICGLTQIERASQNVRPRAGTSSQTVFPPCTGHSSDAKDTSNLQTCGDANPRSPSSALRRRQRFVIWPSTSYAARVRACRISPWSIGQISARPRAVTSSQTAFPPCIGRIQLRGTRQDTNRARETLPSETGICPSSVTMRGCTALYDSLASGSTTSNSSIHAKSSALCVASGKP